MTSIYTCQSMHTPFFPALRPRLAALGRRVQQVRRESLTHLERLLQPWLPPGLLAQADEGANSRERVYSVRRTFFGFLYQVLKPDCDALRPVFNTAAPPGSFIRCWAFRLPVALPLRCSMFQALTPS